MKAIQKKQTADMEFRARLVSAGPNGAWTRLILPKEISALLGSKARVPVAGTINGYKFQTSAFPTGDGTHMITVNTQLQAGAKVKPGETVEVALQLDRSARVVEVPADLATLFSKEKKSSEHFDDLPPSQQKAYVDWIESAKRPETREKRLKDAISRLKRGEKFWK
jgi:hypothetical protein